MTDHFLPRPWSHRSAARWVAGPAVRRSWRCRGTWLPHATSHRDDISAGERQRRLSDGHKLFENSLDESQPFSKTKKYILTILQRAPSALWRRCGLASARIRSVKMRCWCGYLSGVRCRLFANGPADATAIPKPHNILLHLNPDWFYLSWYRVTQVVLKKTSLNGCSSSSSTWVAVPAFVTVFFKSSSHQRVVEILLL